MKRQKPKTDIIRRVAVCRTCRHLVLDRNTPCHYCGKYATIYGILSIPVQGKARPLLTLC